MKRIDNLRDLLNRDRLLILAVDEEIDA